MVNTTSSQVLAKANTTLRSLSWPRPWLTPLSAWPTLPTSYSHGAALRNPRVKKNLARILTSRRYETSHTYGWHGLTHPLNTPLGSASSTASSSTHAIPTRTRSAAAPGSGSRPINLKPLAMIKGHEEPVSTLHLSRSASTFCASDIRRPTCRVADFHDFHDFSCFA